MDQRIDRKGENVRGKRRRRQKILMQTGIFSYQERRELVTFERKGRMREEVGIHESRKEAKMEKETDRIGKL